MNENSLASAALAANTWERYLTDYDEGLGLVYERFVLNDFLDDLRRRHGIKTVLEAPLYGMAGVSGINDVIFARNGVSVTMVDDTVKRAFPKRIEHDPANLAVAWELSRAQDGRLPIGLLYRNTAAERYDLTSQEGLGMSASKKAEAVQANLDRFLV